MKKIRKVISLIITLAISVGTISFNYQTDAKAGINNTGSWGDLGDGYYNNPVLPADYSDPDIIRVDNDYYLITSTFVQSPGITVLHSVDLVNWQIIGGAVKDLTQINSKYNWDSMSGYGRGIWAPCISYNSHNKRFYIHFGDPDFGMYMTYTDDIHSGNWSDLYEVVKPGGQGFGAGWDDCGMLWDDDGQGYFAATHFADGYKDYIFKISNDGYTLQDEGVLVHQSDDGLYENGERSPEALKLFKKDGIYYFYHNGIERGNRKAFIMRSEGIYGKHSDGTLGTFEDIGTYEHIPYPIVEGTREPNQGNLVDIVDDEGNIKWFFWTHQGATDLDGRPNSLVPITWNSDGWPVAGYEDIKKTGLMIWEKIKKPISDSEIKRPQTSDSFENDILEPQWMWNCQPRNEFWSLTERKGFLRLKAFRPVRTDSLDRAGNSIIQRMYRTEGNVVKTKMDISHMENGQYAGLLYIMGGTTAGIGVNQTDGVRKIRYKGYSDYLGETIPDDTQYVYLKSEWSNSMLTKSYYSFDGVTYIQFGDEYQIVKSNYRGGHIGFFNYNNLSDSGYVDFDYFDYEMDVNEKSPVVMGVDNGGVYDLPQNINFSRGTAKLNGSSISNGHRVSGEGTYSLEVKDGEKTSSMVFSLTEDAVEAGITTPFYMNAGGSKTECLSKTWTKDIKYRNSYWGVINGEIGLYDNEQSSVYQTDRHGKNVSLRFDGIEHDYYKIILHFMENEYQEADKRKFDVIIQDKYLDTVDIYNESGYQTPLVKEYDGIQIDDYLTIELDASVGEGTLCAVEIVKGIEPEKTPRPALEVDEVLFGTYNKEQDTFIGEDFENYTFDESKWSGTTSGISVAGTDDIPDTRCGVAPVTGKALSFGKKANAMLSFKEPVQHGQVGFSVDYAQGARIKKISIVDSTGKEVLYITCDQDSTGAKTCNLMYIDDEPVLTKYVNSSRTEHMSLRDAVIDVDENTITYTVGYSMRSNNNDRWFTETNIVELRNIKNIAGIKLDAMDASYNGFIDNVILYSKLPKEVVEPSVSPSASPVPADDSGLVAWYKFDDTIGGFAVDSSGNNYHGTVNGTVSYTDGKQNTAISLDGSSAYIQLPENILGDADDFTISTWAEFKNSKTRNQWLFGFGSGDQEYMFYTPIASTWNPKFAATVGGYKSEQTVITENPTIFDAWQHIAIVKSGSKVTLYINGEAVAENSSFTLSPKDLTLTTSYIGKSMFENDPLLKGNVDNFVIYNESKNEKQVKQLMTGELPLKEGEINIPTPRPQPSYNIKIEHEKKGVDINPNMMGLFFEDINFSADGGLYAELIKNRSFEFFGAEGSKNPETKDLSMDFWTVTKSSGNTSANEIKTENPIHSNNQKYIHFDITDAGSGGVSLSNTGFGGISVKKDEIYDFSMFTRSDTAYSDGYTVSIEKDGTVCAQADINTVLTDKWQKVTARLTANETVDGASFMLKIKGAGSVDIDMVSLFPSDTYNNRENGLRKDLVQALKDINPGFLRFPGGCIIEGYNLENRYQWKDTVGPVEERKTNWSRWQNTITGRHFSDYFQSNGLGFYEYFLLCEDLECEPIPVVNCGMSCQYQSPKEVVPLEDMGQYVQDALDLVEFANGSTETKWGALRASMGHSEPFNLKYIGIGNEQWYGDYFERYELFRAAFAEKYPDIKLITTSGPDPDGAKFDYAWDIFKDKDSTYAYAVDEHYYASPQWFFDNVNRYDEYDRNGLKVFAGEYAAHEGNQPRPNNMYTALAEAAFMTGLERNADVVQLASYAPLFAKVDNWQWTPDMLWFTNSQMYLTPNYYVQKMYSNNMGDYTVQNTLTSSDEALPKELYITTSYDEGTDEIILKVVNSSESKTKAVIDLGTGTKVKKVGKIIELWADSRKAANSISEPDKIKENEYSYSEYSNQFEYELKENSFTIFKIAIDKETTVEDIEIKANVSIPDIVAGNKVTAEFEMKNNTPKNVNIDSYIAMYSENGVLIGVEKSDMYIEAGQKKTYDISKDVLQNTKTVKIFVWNNMTPLYCSSN